MNFSGTFQWQIEGESHFREGGNSWVYRVRRPNDEREYALKLFRFETDPPSLARFNSEIEIVQALHGTPHCVQYIDHGTIGGKPFYVMPFFMNGTLRDKYINKANNLSTIDRLSEFIAICKRVALIHNIGLAIRDIKPQNILIDEDMSPVLADFGLSMWVDTPDDDRQTVTLEKVGSRGYRPPEWHSRYPEPNQRPGDIWSLGRTLWAMMAGQNPPDNYETLGASGNHLSNFIEKQSASIIQSIISACTSQAPGNRPDITALVDLSENTLEILRHSPTATGRRNLDEILSRFTLHVSHSSIFIDAERADSELNIKTSEVEKSLGMLNDKLNEKVEVLNASTPELIGRFQAQGVHEGSAFLLINKIKLLPSSNSAHCGYTSIRFNASKQIQASTSFAYTALIFYLGMAQDGKFFWVVQLGYNGKIIDEVETVALMNLVENKARQLDSFVAKLVDEIQGFF